MFLCMYVCMYVCIKCVYLLSKLTVLTNTEDVIYCNPLLFVVCCIYVYVCVCFCMYVQYVRLYVCKNVNGNSVAIR